MSVRLEDLLGTSDAPEDLHIWTEVERGLPGIEEWLTTYPKARMVVVDVLAKFRARNTNQDRYQADFDAISDLKSLADRHSAAIVVVHHTRKSAADDFLEEVSGTNGIVEACDTIAVLRRGAASID